MKKLMSAKLLTLLLGALAIIVGFWTGYLWLQTQNMMLAFLCVVSLPAGAWLIWRTLKQPGGGLLIPSSEPTTVGEEINAVNITADIIDGDVFPKMIEFAHEEKPRGRLHKCLNNGKYYYIQITNKDTGNLEAFQLPDFCQYYDPKEYANVLTLPGHKDLYTKRATLMQKITPAILVGAIAIGFIFMLIIE